MRFENELIKGRLIQRYKRFLADVELEDGTTVTAHCTNSGTMKTCLESGADVYLSPSNNPNRKTLFTWEMIYINTGWVGINTTVPNKLVFDAVRNQEIPELCGYTKVLAERKYDDSRFDVYAENEHEQCFIEVKNVSMKLGDYALFPDAVTTRGRKHLETLIKAKKEGYRAVMVYVIQRADVTHFGPAKDIDPDYSETLKKAYNSGVEILPYQAKVSPESIVLTKKLPFRF